MSKSIEPVKPLESDPSLRAGAGPGGPPDADNAGAGGSEPGGDSADPEAGKANSEAKLPRSLYHVVGPGSVFFQGKVYESRSTLRLTDAEAEDLGDGVRPGKPPPSKAQVGARKGGVYVVAGPGSVWHGGKAHEKGALLDLSEADARSLGDAVEDVK